MRTWRFAAVVSLAVILAGCGAAGRLTDGAKVSRTFGQIQTSAGVPVKTIGPLVAPDGTRFGLYHYQTGNRCVDGLVRVEQGVAANGSGSGGCNGSGLTRVDFAGGSFVYGYAEGARAVAVQLPDGTESKATLDQGFWYLFLPVPNASLDGMKMKVSP